MLNSNKETKTTVHFHSQRRYHGDASRFTIDFGRPIKHVKLIELFQVEVPNTIWNVNENQYQLQWQDSLGEDHTTQIALGDYDDNQLLSAIEDAMNADTTDGNTYTVSTGTNNHLVTISSPGSNFILNTSNSSNSLFYALGFDTDNDLSGDNSYTASNVYDFTYTKSILISTNLPISDRSINDTGNHGSVLYKLQRRGQFGDILFNEFSRPLQFRCEIDEIHNMEVHLLDDQHRPLQLRGRDLSGTIIFHGLVLG